MSDPLHILKLCVGAESVDDLAGWQQRRSAAARAAGRDPRPAHVTRMWPRRGAEVLAGGSLYWVIKGLVLVRQPILALDPAPGGDGVTRCALVLDPGLIRTRPQPRRPFQGWRYLRAEDAPADLGPGAEAAADLPPGLVRELAAIGVL